MKQNLTSTPAKAQASKTIPPETIGREYSLKRVGLHSRKLGTESWYGVTNYRTQAEAEAALGGAGQRFVNLGGLVMDFGEGQDVYEYRIVESVSACKVISTCFKKI